MGPTWIKAPLFTVTLVLLFVWSGEVITNVSGGAEAAVTGEGVGVDIGEQVFWGPGKCHTCHAIGTRGRSVRGPNLGESEHGPPIGARAVERGRERGAELGVAVGSTEYLIESLADPSAYVVKGFKAEMPKAYEPPISLNPDEVTSVILYLQSVGGVPDPSSIVLPLEVREGARAMGTVTPWEPYMEGDSLRGAEIFFDVDGPTPCAKCHRVGDRGGEVGPELTGIAGTRTARFILESVVDPSREIASGYETVLIQTAAGRLMDGVVRRETDDSLFLATSDGDELSIALSKITRRGEQELSLMPGDFTELLTVKQLHDLLAFLRTLR